jgi:hypothetical protein
VTARIFYRIEGFIPALAWERSARSHDLDSSGALSDLWATLLPSRGALHGESLGSSELDLVSAASNGRSPPNVPIGAKWVTTSP